jgi:hypothetical protein
MESCQWPRAVRPRFVPRPFQDASFGSPDSKSRRNCMGVRSRWTGQSCRARRPWPGLVVLIRAVGVYCAVHGLAPLGQAIGLAHQTAGQMDPLFQASFLLSPAVFLLASPLLIWGADYCACLCGESKVPEGEDEAAEKEIHIRTLPVEARTALRSTWPCKMRCRRRRPEHPQTAGHPGGDGGSRHGHR